MAANNEKITQITSFEKPVCRKTLQSFLGMTGYYRKFIPHYAKIAAPLESILGKNSGSTNRSCKTFTWTPEAVESFETLKAKLTTTPILAFPDRSKEFVLDTDASFDTIGAVLSQKLGSHQEQVIAYGSRKMKRHELGYCVTRKELLSIVHFEQHFKAYLYGKNFS